MLGADAGCERQSVAKGIFDRHIPGTPGHVFNSRPSVLVLSRAEFGVKGIQAVRLNPHRRARAAIAMMLGQVQDAPIPRHLHVQRKSGLESMLPVDGETKEADIELSGLGLVENPKDRRRLPKAHAVLLVHLTSGITRGANDPESPSGA